MRRLLWPGLMTVVMLAVLLGLGTWQVHRLHWKEAHPGADRPGRSGAAVPLPAGSRALTPKSPSPATCAPTCPRNTRVEVRDTREGPQTGHLPDPTAGTPGAAAVVGGARLGAAEAQRPDRTTAGRDHRRRLRPRSGDTPGLFSATDDPAARIFYTLDPAAIGAALGLPHVAPFILIALGPAPPELWPDPAKHLPQPPNNHLSYAITWYGLAVALVVIFLVWARRTLRA